jgi:TnpA family transposase
MPSIRNWQDLHLFRPGAGDAYTHIDALFSGSIDWTLIAEHLPDMKSRCRSRRAGCCRRRFCADSEPTAPRTGSTSAFRELGRAIRTAFLLRYIRSIDLRRTIGAATNKSKHFNRYAQWAGFGGWRARDCGSPRRAAQDDQNTTTSSLTRLRGLGPFFVFGPLNINGLG